MRNRFTKTCAAVAVVGTLALVGCSQPSAQGDADTDAADAPQSDTSGLQTAKDLVAEYTGIVDGYLPSEPLGDTSSLSGLKIMYIPAVGAIPYFATSHQAASNAFGELGMTVDLCDAQANPSSFSSCFNQVITQGYSGVIVDSIAPELALEAYNEVAASGVPMVLINVGIPESSPESVVGFSGPNILGQQLASSAIIADSEGTANVIGVKVIDHDASKMWWDEGAAQQYADLCPDCTLNVVETKTADLQNLPPKVSAALLQNPDATYLQPQLSPETTPTLQGATDAGRTDVSAAVAAATLADLQQVESGSALKWAVGWDNVRMQWLGADLLARLLLGLPTEADQYSVAPRLFSAENVDGLDVSQEGWDSSDWFGGSGYQETLISLWG